VGAHLKCTRQKLTEALQLRYAPCLHGGAPTPCEHVAKHIGVSSRQLRSTRMRPLWREVLSVAGTELDDENAQHVRGRLGQLPASQNEAIALGAAKCVLQLLTVRQLDLRVSGVVEAQWFDLSNVSPERLRALASAVASVEGVSPAQRCLPVGDDPDEIDGEAWPESVPESLQDDVGRDSS